MYSIFCYDVTDHENARTGHLGQEHHLMFLSYLSYDCSQATKMTVELISQGYVPTNALFYTFQKEQHPCCCPKRIRLCIIIIMYFDHLYSNTIHQKQSSNCTFCNIPRNTSKEDLCRIAWILVVSTRQLP